MDRLTDESWGQETFVYLTWKEVTLYTIGIADTNLDVVLLGKTCIWIEWLPLPEDSANRIV